MADTFTTTLSLTKPEVGASADTWGTKLNDNLDDIDALFSAGPVLKVANGGTAATTASGARTSLGLGTMATQDASSVAITGGSAIGMSSVATSSASPNFRLFETGATTDEGGWDIGASGDAMYFGAYDDAFSAGNIFFYVARTGTTVDSIALTATAVTINGNAAFHAGTFTAPTSGSFEMSLRTGSPTGTTIGTGTAYWRKFNNVVTLRIPSIIATSAATSLWLAGLPAEIRVGDLGLSSQQIPTMVVNDGSAVPGVAQIAEEQAYITIYPSGTGWEAVSNTKGASHTCITYQIAN